MNFFIVFGRKSYQQITAFPVKLNSKAFSTGSYDFRWLRFKIQTHLTILPKSAIKTAISKVHYMHSWFFTIFCYSSDMFMETFWQTGKNLKKSFHGWHKNLIHYKWPVNTSPSAIFSVRIGGSRFQNLDDVIQKFYEFFTWRDSFYALTISIYLNVALATRRKTSERS